MDPWGNDGISYVCSNELKDLAAEMPEEDDFQDLDNIQSPRTALTYKYDRAMLSNTGGTKQIKLDIGAPCHWMINKFDRKRIS